jgi:hypothetical protein
MERGSFVIQKLYPDLNWLNRSSRIEQKQTFVLSIWIRHQNEKFIPISAKTCKVSAKKM